MQSCTQLLWLVLHLALYLGDALVCIAVALPKCTLVGTYVTKTTLVVELVAKYEI